jgi:hypothetical protein
MAMFHATVSPGARVVVPWRRDFNALVYILAGKGFVGPDRRPVVTGQLVVLGGGDTIEVSADERQESRSPSLEALMMGGRPIREPVAAYGPFVMSTRAEIVQAFEDYEKGKLGTIPTESTTPR